MNSYLITGPNEKQRLEATKKLIKKRQLKIKDLTNHPDLLIVKPVLSIGIGKIRQVQQFLSRKPYQEPIKAVIIFQAEKLTIPAQNAFLKTLEEPPKNSLIILSCQNQDQLLATVVSRCQLIKLQIKTTIPLDQKAVDNHLLLINKILKSKVGERLKLIEPYTKNREEAVKFCQEMIISLRQKLRKQNKSLTTIKSFQQTLSWLEANVNVKLALENLVITLN